MGSELAVASHKGTWICSR